MGTPENRNWVRSLLALVMGAVGGAAFLGTARQADESAKPTAAAESAKEDPTIGSSGGEWRSPLDVLLEYVREEGVTRGEEVTNRLEFRVPFWDATFTREWKGSGAKTPSPEEILSLAPPADYEFLIATVPDPVESRFPHEFDNIVAAIQRAFEARHFGLRTYWMPWTRAHGGAPHPSRSTIHREHPGVLIFRQSRKSTSATSFPGLRFAIVCLVGETPHSGLHKPAMRRALKGWEDLNKLVNKKDEPADPVKLEGKLKWAETFDGTGPTVRVVSPCFSGSQQPLTQVLKSWRAEQKPNISLINGAATAIVPAVFGDQPITSTVIQNHILTEEVYRYLGGAGQLTDRVAILREGNTMWGLQKDFVSQSPMVSEPVLDIPFPASISQLQADQERAVKRSVLPRTDFVERRMPIRDTQNDDIAPFDPEAAASTSGQTIRAILGRIEQSRVRYVGIEATDARDVVFFNRLIRAHCPNVRVFTTEPSVALLHPEDATHMRGMLVASTYPLYPTAQSWSREPDPKDNGGGQHANRDEKIPRHFLPFPSQSSQGYYNAVLALFGDYDRMLGYRYPRLPGGPLPHPPVWISVIGEGGRLIPVSWNTESSSSVKMVSNPGPTKGVPQEQELAAIGIPLWVMVAAFLAVVAVGFTIWVVGWDDGWDWLNDWDREGVSPPLVEGDWPRVWRFVLLLCVLLFVLPFTLPARECFGDSCCGLPRQRTSSKLGSLPSTWRHYSILFASWTILVVLIGLWGLLVVRAFRPRTGGGSKPEATESQGGLIVHLVYGVTAACFIALWVVSTWPHLCSATVVFAVVVIPIGVGACCRGSTHAAECAGAVSASVLATHVWWGAWTPKERFLWYVRSADLAAGMAPWVPMALLAATAAALAWCSLRQVNSSRDAWLNSPFRRRDWRELLVADKKLRIALERPIRSLIQKDRWFLSLVIAVVFVLVLLWNVAVISLPSAEGAVWDRMMRLAFWATAGGIVFALVRFLDVWSRMSHLLGEILRVPMVGAFERLPTEIGRLFGHYLSAQWPRHQHLAALAWTLPVPARQRLAEAIMGRRGLAWVFGQPTTSAPTSVPGDANPTSPPATTEDDDRLLRDALRTQARDYLTLLPAHWANQPAEAVFGGLSRPQLRAGEQEGQPDAAPTGESVHAAEEFVAAYIVLYLGRYFAQLRMLVYAIAFSAPMLLLAAASYPFEPDRPRLLAVVGLIAAVAVGIVYVLFKINKDGLVSRITRTTPNAFTPDAEFLYSVTTYVLPLIGLVLLQVLGLFRFVIEPILGLFG